MTQKVIIIIYIFIFLIFGIFTSSFFLIYNRVELRNNKMKK